MKPDDKLRGKKLLVLGANAETKPLIETAQKMGAIVYCTDNNPKAPAKIVADTACNIDGTDVEGLTALVLKEGIDGVMVGVADRLIVPYHKLCSSLGLPCYANDLSVKFLTDKQRFNELCARLDIPTIPNYDVESIDAVANVEFNFPILVKPVDSNSGKGMSICHEEQQLKSAYLKAQNASKRGKVLVEKYMQCDDLFVYYTFINGEVIVSAIADRFTSNEQGELGRVCIGALYPSKHSDLYFRTLHSKMLRLFEQLQIKNGVFLVSAFVENNTIHLYDPGFRLQGESPDIPIKVICKYDQKEMLIRFALTGRMVDDSSLEAITDYSFNGQKAASIWLLGKEGRICSIEGLQHASKHPSGISVLQRLFVGDDIPKEAIGTEGQVIARVYVISDSQEVLASKVKHLQKVAKVLNSRGVNMLLNSFNPNLINYK